MVPLIDDGSSLRHVPLLRTLRFAGLLVFLAGTVLRFALVDVFSASGETDARFLVSAALLLFLWLLAYGIGNGRKLVPAVLLGAGWLTLAGFQGYSWWMVYSASSFSAVPLLAQAMGSLGLGLTTVTGLVLQGFQNLQGAHRGSLEDPARLCFRTREERKSGDAAPWERWSFGWPRRICLVLAPVVALTAAVAAGHFLLPAAAISHTTASPSANLPERPSRIGSDVAWSREAPGLLGVVAGAAGPVILAEEGVTALNPVDGSTLWSYRRPHARYDYHDKLSEIRYMAVSRTMVASPTGRHVALLINGPQTALSKSSPAYEEYTYLTLVFDTITGRITGEHPSNGWRLQLTDSTLLDGNEAYSLTTGELLWSLKDSDMSKHGGYSGPAGHRSFIIEKDRGNLTLVPDTDPTAMSKVQGIAIDPRRGVPAIVDGWTAQYTEPLPELDEYGFPRYPVAEWNTRAVTLDSLAGLEDETPVDLGRAAGANLVASRASGALVTYPPYDKSAFEQAEQSGGPLLEAVFDPTTRTVTPASQYAGPAAAKVGFVAHPEGGAISLHPGDGSPGVTISILPGTTHFSPETLLFKNFRTYSPAQLATREPEHTGATLFMNAPGVTMVILNAEEISTGSSDRKGQRYRLFGVTGGVS